MTAVSTPASSTRPSSSRKVPARLRKDAWIGVVTNDKQKKKLNRVCPTDSVRTASKTGTNMIHRTSIWAGRDRRADRGAYIILGDTIAMCSHAAQFTLLMSFPQLPRCCSRSSAASSMSDFGSHSISSRRGGGGGVVCRKLPGGVSLRWMARRRVLGASSCAVTAVVRGMHGSPPST